VVGFHKGFTVAGYVRDRDHLSPPAW
jgi:Bifunctional DNA primase/polymerase, N-terminal